MLYQSLDIMTGCVILYQSLDMMTGCVMLYQSLGMMTGCVILYQSLDRRQSDGEVGLCNVTHSMHVTSGFWYCRFCERDVRLCDIAHSVHVTSGFVILHFYARDTRLCDITHSMHMTPGCVISHIYCLWCDAALTDTAFNVVRCNEVNTHRTHCSVTSCLPRPRSFHLKLFGAHCMWYMTYTARNVHVMYDLHCT